MLTKEFFSQIEFYSEDNCNCALAYTYIHSIQYDYTCIIAICFFYTEWIWKYYYWYSGSFFWNISQHSNPEISMVSNYMVHHRSITTQIIDSRCVLTLSEILSSHSIVWRASWVVVIPALRWRHNECDSVSNHQPHDCLLSRLSGRRSK